MSEDHDPSTEPDTDATPDTGAEPAADLSAEVDKWKSLARKHEERAKANAHATKELEQLRQQSMSDADKAIAAARAEAEADANRRWGVRLVDERLRNAAAGRPVDVDALLEGVDRTRFLGDDGEPDTDAIAAWMDRVAPRPPEPEPGMPTSSLDLGQGTRGAPAMPLNGDPLEAFLRHELGIR